MSFLPTATDANTTAIPATTTTTTAAASPTSAAAVRFEVTSSRINFSAAGAEISRPRRFFPSQGGPFIVVVVAVVDSSSQTGT